MGKGHVNRKKGRTPTALDWQANSLKKNQVEHQMQGEGTSLWHGHKQLFHKPKQCVPIAVQLDENALVSFDKEGGNTIRRSCEWMNVETEQAEG